MEQGDDKMWLIGKILEFKKEVEEIKPGIYIIHDLTEYPNYILRKITHLGSHGEKTYDMKDNKIITAKISAHKIGNRKNLNLPILLKRKKQYKFLLD